MAATHDPVEVAREAGLRYVSDDDPGIRREKKGESFYYVGPDAKRVRDRVTLARIRSLAIPPAWTNVWICPRVNGHIQAVGRDARGRKQYRYHALWRQTRDEAKYNRTIAFGLSFLDSERPPIVTYPCPDCRRAKVLAAVVRILEKSLIRVGNEEYAKTNGSFGLTTLREKHVDVEGGTIRFHFRGKSAVKHAIRISDARLARIVKRCQELPGQRLFQFLDEEGRVHDVTSEDVNGYIREAVGDDFSAKDFRTWAGTVLAALALREFEAFDSHTQAKRNIMTAIKSVAQRLGNTPTICRRCYVHPHVLDAYLDGTMVETFRQRTAKAMNEVSDLRPEEAMVLALLQRRLTAKNGDS